MPLHGVTLHGRRDSLKSQSIQVTEKPVSRRSWFQAGNRSSTDGDRPDAGVEDDTTVVEPDQNNVLSHIISQLRPGADLSRITLPTFILEERSMLERITNFMAHPDTLLPMPTIDDPLQRFVSVVKFYLSGWHIKPPGVKKPLNPILGETFTCYWDYPDSTKGYYISEQTSHHPPKSSYFFMAPEHNIRVDGCLKPRSKFLGNSAASMMEGISYLRFTNRGKGRGGEKYIVTQPNMYARGILFGKMKYELGDHSYVRCPENGLSADLEFKTKGYFSGAYNATGGTIKDDKSGNVLYELSGFWSGEMFIKDVSTGMKTLLFDATHAKHSVPLARPIPEQSERESQRLWESTVKAVHVADHKVATEEKAKIEDRQREEAKKRDEEAIEWRPKLFRRVNAGPGGSEEGEEDLEWIINAEIDATNPKKAINEILAIAPILPGQKLDMPSSTPSQNHNPEKPSQAPPPASLAAPVQTQKHATNNNSNNLIDFSDSSRTATPQPPTVNKPLPKQPAVGLMDDDSHVDLMNQKMQQMNMNMHQPIAPKGHDEQPLKRTNTDDSEIDSFFDAEDTK